MGRTGTSTVNARNESASMDRALLNVTPMSLSLKQGARFTPFLLAALMGVTACAEKDYADADAPEWVDGKSDGQQSLFYKTIVSKTAMR